MSLFSIAVAVIVLGGAGFLVWMLVNGFQTGRMDALRAMRPADRTAEPKMFWFNAMLNAGWLIGCAILLLHIVRNGGI